MGLMTGCSTLAIAAALPRMTVRLLGLGGGQLAEAVGFDICRWNEINPDPIEDMRRWADWIMNGTGRL